MEKGEPLFFGLRPVWSEAKEEEGRKGKSLSSSSSIKGRKV